MYMGKKQEITILYEDRSVCVCKKPVGIPCESAKASQPDMVKLLKKQYFLQNPENGEPYIALVHRLDQPVGGIMVFARNQAAAADLSQEIKSHTWRKQYLAVVTLQGKPEVSGHLEDYIIKDGKTNASYVVKAKTEKAKLAVLDYEILRQQEDKALAKIMLETGRHHQIRVQMAAHDMPLLYDMKYNPIYKDNVKGKSNIALYAYSLAFSHPVTKDFMEFTDYPLEEPFAEWLNKSL